MFAFVSLPVSTRHLCARVPVGVSALPGFQVQTMKAEKVLYSLVHSYIVPTHISIYPVTYMAMVGIQSFDRFARGVLHTWLIKYCYWSIPYILLRAFHVQSQKTTLRWIYTWYIVVISSLVNTTLNTQHESCSGSYVGHIRGAGFKLPADVAQYTSTFSQWNRQRIAV